MLSSHALGSIDGGPLPPSVPSPVQGLDQLHVESQPRSIDPLSIHIPITPPSDAHISETLSSRNSPSLTRPSGGLRRHESNRCVDTGSPKLQSPLRNSVSFTDLTNLGILGLDHGAPQFLKEHQTPLDSQPTSPAMSLTGDKAPGSAEGTQRNRFSGWFGRGANVEGDGSSCSAIQSPRIAKSTSNTPKVSPATKNNRFSFFGNPVTSSKTNFPAPVYEDDELATLDIPAALFPGGQGDGAAFSPAAFKNLQMTATGLLMRYQVAYQQRNTELRDIKAEQEAQAEEQGEMETRVQHLKMQLEEMGRKVAERESTMQALLDELTQEKQARMEEHMAARAKYSRPSNASTISEDLGVEEDQRRHGRRSSAETTKSDSSLDTDEESVDEESIFSRSRSPTIANSINEAEQQALPKKMILGTQRQTKPSNPQFTGPFQKLFKAAGSDQPPSGCHKCKETGLAWETVNVLKSENKGLKNRVEELETAVETALDAVNGLMIAA